MAKSRENYNQRTLLHLQKYRLLDFFSLTKIFVIVHWTLFSSFFLPLFLFLPALLQMLNYNFFLIVKYMDDEKNGDTICISSNELYPYNHADFARPL